MSDERLVKLATEWETISKSLFWKDFSGLIAAKRAAYLSKCLRDREDALYRAQGAVEAIDIIAKLPELITGLQGSGLEVK